MQPRIISLDASTPVGNIANMFERLTSTYPTIASASRVAFDNGKPSLEVPDVECIGEILMDCMPSEDEESQILEELL